MTMPISCLFLSNKIAGLANGQLERLTVVCIILRFKKLDNQDYSVKVIFEMPPSHGMPIIRTVCISQNLGPPCMIELIKTV